MSPEGDIYIYMYMEYVLCTKYSYVILYIYFF